MNEIQRGEFNTTETSNLCPASGCGGSAGPYRGAKLLDEDIDGKSTVPVVRSAIAPSPHEVLHWHVGRGRAAQWAVRQGDWKLIGNLQETFGDKLSAEDKKLFLSNLAMDISEKQNLASSHPDVVQRLLKLRQNWIAANPEPPVVLPSRDKAGNEK